MFFEKMKQKIFRHRIYTILNYLINDNVLIVQFYVV